MSLSQNELAAQGGKIVNAPPLAPASPVAPKTAKKASFGSRAVHAALLAAMPRIAGNVYDTHCVNHDNRCIAKFARTYNAKGVETTDDEKLADAIYAVFPTAEVVLRRNEPFHGKHLRVMFFYVPESAPARETWLRTVAREYFGTEE